VHHRLPVGAADDLVLLVAGDVPEGHDALAGP
jgi:hypothetical protein